MIRMTNPLRKTSAHAAEMPPLGLGTGSLGADCSALVARALQCGYRHLDTARKYGTERGVGEGLRRSGVRRADVFLTTKVSHEDLHATDFERSTETSLRALGVEYL